MNTMTTTEAQLRRRLALLDRDREETLDRLALVSAFGDDVYEHGAVITYEKHFDRSGQTYSYAAIKSPHDGHWYTTGPVGGARAQTWEELVSWLTSGPRPTTEVWLVSELERVTS